MRYFVDTNVIIDILNQPQNMGKLLPVEDGNKFYINQLVYLESLRTIDIQKTKIFGSAQTLLNNFTILDMNQDIYDQTVQFSRFCRSQGILLKGKCEAIDFLHFMTAKYYQLELLSNDKDIEKLKITYVTWKES
jgi:predicted nucleic acid-binding protein